MPTERRACREADSAGSNFGVEAPWIEPASRNKSEPESASLRSVRSANLSEMPKPAIRREATFTRSGGDLRGRWGQRAGKVWLGRPQAALRESTRKQTKSTQNRAGLRLCLVVAKGEIAMLSKMLEDRFAATSS